ncbi:MAG: HAD family hydrolase [Methylobacter sp.]
MSMVIVFDLDDTLYEERTYVESGLRAVAAFGEEEFGWNSEDSFIFMVDILNRVGRGMIFDLWLKQSGKCGKGLIRQCVNVYRHHTPKLQLFDSAKELLPRLKGYPMYIVTDGHKLVQEKKVRALEIEMLFRHVFITHRYGVKNAKPSTYCFELIKRRENCDWEDIMYVGDNPSKDFVSLNGLKMRTVRVLTGGHRNTMAAEGYDAQFTILNLTYFSTLLEGLRHEK